MSNANFDRRQITAGLAAAMTLPLAGGLIARPRSRPRSEHGALGQPRRTFGGSAEARPFVPRMSLAPSAGGDTYAEQLPAVIDFMDSVQGSAPDATGVSSAQVDALLERASDILRTARNAERVPRDIPEPGAAAVTAPKLEAIADDYRKLFATCQIRDANRSDVQWYVSKITDPDAPQILRAGDRGNLRAVVLRGHHPRHGRRLRHQGPPPQRRPAEGQDRSGAEGPSQSLEPAERTGFRARSTPCATTSSTRRPIGISPPCSIAGRPSTAGAAARSTASTRPTCGASPTTTSKGKFVADNVWDSNAVSKQCGAAVMLKALVEIRRRRPNRVVPQLDGGTSPLPAEPRRPRCSRWASARRASRSQARSSSPRTRSPLR